MYSKQFDDFLYWQEREQILRKEKQELMRVLKKDFNWGVISKNEIMDMKIDLELYNKKCKNKRRRK